MRGNRRGVSLGTVLTIILTLSVIAGCVFVFTRIQGSQPDARMSAQKVIGLVGDALNGATPVPVPQSTVRTVTVTLAPAPAVTAAPGGPTAAPAPTADQNARRSFTLTAGGLIAFESDISDSVYDKSARTFSFGPILSLLRPRVDGDLTLSLLPQTVNTADQKYGDTLAPASALEGIRGAGFEQVLLNSSHALDQGIQGVNQTAEALAQTGLTGTGFTAGSAQQHRMIQLNGVHIALLTYAEALTAKGKIARESQPEVMRLYSRQQAEEDIAAFKAQGADFVIVSLYWSKADATGVTSAMRNTAYALAEAGADLILGYHPSRVLPLETTSVPDENGIQRQCLIAYSMGTLLSESREGYDISGLLLHLKITCENGLALFETIDYSPTYIWRYSANGKTHYRVVCSSENPPEGMDARQKEVMARALNRIQNAMKDGPAEQRK